MEKKNMVLLTVIAVATLLVAVVGATFAFFSATVTTENDDDKTVTVKAQVMASAKMKYGDTVNSEDALPGFKASRELEIIGSCPQVDGQPADSCSDIQGKIIVTPSLSGAATFSDNVKWSLYEVKSCEGLESCSTAITCSSDVKTDGGKYRDEATCTNTGAGNATKVIDSDSPESSAVITVKKDTHSYYYLVVEYENTVGAQNDEQGKQFSVSIDFKALDATD